ncbi:MAG TPA: Calx-beta domain-containing protein [Anaerolineae bacterium]
MRSSRRHQLVHFSIGLLLFAVVITTFISALPQTTAGTARAASLLQNNPAISFNSLNQNVGEGAGTASVAVVATGNITETISVEYLTLNGTANAPSDFVSASGTLTFTSSIMTREFEVRIIDDSLSEPSETINLVLRNPRPDYVTLGTGNSTLTILDNDPTPTPTATGGPPILVDAHEPNDSFEEATDIASDAPALCQLTLWPVGDQDFFRFVAKRNAAYEILTSGLSPGLDTAITVYNTQLNEIASNDDYQIGSRASRVTITANVDGFYYIRVVNKDPSDPANKRYCLEVSEIPPPTPPAAFPTGTDACEFNSTFETACVIGPGQTINLTFVPSLGSEQDTDKFRLWVKPGIFYTCETSNLSPVTDTNIILYNGNEQPFSPPIGNDDKAPGELGSRVTYLSTYTGWLYVEVGPVNPPESLEVARQMTYDLLCTAVVATPTPPATATFAAPPGGFPSATRTPTPLPLPTPTPFDISVFFTPTPLPPPIIQVQPLPTATAFAAGQSVTVNVTLYYDSNLNFMPELTEGIADVAIALYDNATGQLLAFGQTNEAGMIRFSSVNALGAVRVVVPFLNYSQTVPGGSTDILLRVAPQPLPIGIP